MGKYLMIFFLVSGLQGFGQNSRYQYTPRFIPEIKSDKVKEARFLNQIMPEFTTRFALPYNEHEQFRELTSLFIAPTTYYNYPQGNYLHIRENYETIIEYVAIEIVCRNNGKEVRAKSTDDILTTEQKKILNSADLGADILIKIKFRYKGWVNAKYKSGEDIKEGSYSVVMVPETEAEYPGGIDKLSSFLGQNIFNKLSSGKQISNFLRASVKFNVNENGVVENVRIEQSSTDKAIDNLIRDAINKMPVWKAAKDSQGIKVNQEFTLSFNGGGC
ncbi:MAG: hypothetical protein K0Q95_2818 [Bacteroidota bacterium]|jgi:TonB family protein|nr:hypothetical protein [Bacteroidota bacterium]